MGHLEDFTVREDTALNEKYTDSYGWFDLEGLTMTRTDSTYLYLATQSKAVILEYEWHSSHKILRRFTLPNYDTVGNAGIQSLTWIPSQSANSKGFFYVGSHTSGRIF